MYHCHVQFYLAGRPCRAFELIKEMSPMEHFTYEFSESETPCETLAAKATVIFANLEDMDVKAALKPLICGKSEETELVLLTKKEQAGLLTERLTSLKDLWTTPMSDEEIRFRLLRWQQAFKMGKDFWQPNHFLEAAIDNTPNLIWYKDKNGIHEKVNNSFCQTVNKSKAQVEGRGHAYIWDVEHDDPVCIESERKVMEHQKTYVSEEKIETGEGERLLETYKSPLYDLDGSVMGTVGVAIDVTKEHDYKLEIISKNRTLETIFTTMDCGIMCHTVDGSRILSINRAALKILGYETQEEMIAAGFDMVADSVLDEDKGALREAICSLKNEGDSISVEYRVSHKDGSILHIMGNVKLIEENGEPLYQRFLLDCTAQKLQEKKNEQYHKELIQALGVDYSLVCYYNLNTGKGIPLRMSDEDRDIFEFIFTPELSLDESIQLYMQKFVYEDDRKMLQQAVDKEKLQKELEEKKLYYVNYRTQKYGEMKYYQMKFVYAGALDDSHGIVLGLRSVDAEIRSEMEQKSLLEDALLQANRASKAKSVFLSNMSHDIRTPMNAIVGFTALAITHIDRRDQVEEYLKKIMTSGNHLLSLINDVLDMSRIESGKMHLEEKPCRLPDILHGLRNIVQADIHAKQLDLYIDTVDVFDEEIFCDKLRLNQVLLNLLSNSIKYTLAGGIISLRITEKPGAPAGYANYEFLIKDTGVGMSEEFVAHIFESFEREKNTTISGIQGTGLGMAITKNIIDMMNGTIEVKSEKGVGTEFIVTIMFRLNTQVNEIRDIPELKNSRALVVDDDFNTCDSVSYMLSQIGMRAEWTLSGKEAILRTRQAESRNDGYCVYIIDWLLPDMNGIEVTRRIRNEIGEHVPVIILTAYDWSEIEDEAKEAGVTAFCSKPLFLSELRDCLYSIVSSEDEKETDSHVQTESISTGRVLLAEDNELNQEIAAEILRDAGFHTEIAPNGQIALDMLKNSNPGYYQVVLMDVQMPVMNGYEAAKEIRRLTNPKLSSIPILAMTANAFEEDKQEALRCGMNGHIAKPIDIDNLFEMLRKALA